MGLDILNPRFSWVLESNHRGAKQTAYQILVASSTEKLNANTWRYLGFQKDILPAKYSD